MFQLKMKITLLKQKNCEGENHFDGNDNKNAKLFKSQISLLQQENSFIVKQKTKYNGENVRLQEKSIRR